MNATQQNYRFDLVAPSDQPGAVAFRDADDGQYYFVFNDNQGRPLLYSQPYKDKNSRDNGLKSLIKNGRIPKRFEIKEADEQYYFIVRAGNNVEIGCSRSFQSELDTRQAMSFVREKLMADYGADPKAVKSAKSPGANSKYTFLLEFYPREGGDALRGRIEYPRGDQRESFDGVDLAKIENFLNRHLPKRRGQPAVQAKPRNGMAIKLPESLQRRNACLNREETDSLPLVLSYPEQTDFPQRVVVDVIARPLAESQPSLVGKMTREVSNSTVIDVPLMMKGLLPGSYRFIFQTHSHSVQSPDAERLAETSQLFLVY